MTTSPRQSLPVRHTHYSCPELFLLANRMLTDDLRFDFLDFVHLDNPQLILSAVGLRPIVYEYIYYYYHGL